MGKAFEDWYNNKKNYPSVNVSCKITAEVAWRAALEWLYSSDVIDGFILRHMIEEELRDE